jgi:hypothetical protein
MTRAPAVNQGVILPTPPERYDAADQRETRRLLEEALRRLLQWGTVSDVPGNIASLGNLDGGADGLPYFTDSEQLATTTLTAFARLLIAAVDGQSARTVLGLGFTGERTTLTLITGSIAADATETGTLSLSTSTAALLSIVADQPCWLRFYASADARTADAARDIDTRGTPGTGLLAEFVFDTAGQLIPVSPVAILASEDAVPSVDVYYAVQNLSGASTAITITPLILPLELP